MIFPQRRHEIFLLTFPPNFVNFLFIFFTFRTDNTQAYWIKQAQRHRWVIIWMTFTTLTWTSLLLHAWKTRCLFNASSGASSCWAWRRSCRARTRPPPATADPRQAIWAPACGRPVASRRHGHAVGIAGRSRQYRWTFRRFVSGGAQLLRRLLPGRACRRRGRSPPTPARRSLTS